MFFLSSHKKINTKKGFTLIEMIMVIAIIATVTAVVLFNNGKLNSAILVSNTAYEIGLIVRESQVAGLGVKAAVGTTGTPNFSSSYGVHFDLTTPTKIIMFADKDNNKAYTVGEMTQEFNISNKRSGSVLNICAKSSGSTGSCTVNNTTYTNLSTADVIFTRPNPEAFFKVGTVSGGALTEHSGAVVVNIGFFNDICRSVTIEKTGAVQVDSTTCPSAQASQAIE